MGRSFNTQGQSVGDTSFHAEFVIDQEVVFQGIEEVVIAQTEGVLEEALQKDQTELVVTLVTRLLQEYPNHPRAIHWQTLLPKT